MHRLLRPDAPAAQSPPGLHWACGLGIDSDTPAELDHRIGQVVDAIDEAGIADGTIVVWRGAPLDRGPGQWRHG